MNRRSFLKVLAAGFASLIPARFLPKQVEPVCGVDFGKRDETVMATWEYGFWSGAGQNAMQGYSTGWIMTSFRGEGDISIRLDGVDYEWHSINWEPHGPNMSVEGVYGDVIAIENPSWICPAEVKKSLQDYSDSEAVDVWVDTDQSGVYVYCANGEYYHAVNYFLRDDPIWWFCVNLEQTRQKHLESLAVRIQSMVDFQQVNSLNSGFRLYCKDEEIRLRKLAQWVSLYPPVQL